MRLDGLEVVRELGRGANGCVLEVAHGADRFALKHALDSSRRASILREIEALRRLPMHPNLVRFVDAGTWRGEPAALLELAPAMRIAGHAGKLTDEQVLSVGVQLIGALAALHAIGIAHNDTASGENVLYDMAHIRPILADLGRWTDSRFENDLGGVGSLLFSLSRGPFDVGPYTRFLEEPPSPLRDAILALLQAPASGDRSAAAWLRRFG